MNILIVDDNSDYLTLMTEALFGEGYTVFSAVDGIEGCEVLTSRDINLIISDIRMPRLDGLKLHAFAREIERYKKTPFIFLSGYKEVYQHAVQLDPAIDHFVDKTTPIGSILDLVNRLLFGKFAADWL